MKKIYILGFAALLAFLVSIVVMTISDKMVLSMVFFMVGLSLIALTAMFFEDREHNSHYYVDRR